MKTSNTTGFTRFQRLAMRDSLQPLLGRCRIDWDFLSLTTEGLQTLFAAPADTFVRRRGPCLDSAGNRAPNGPLGELCQNRYPGVNSNGGRDLFAKASDKIVTTGDDIGPGK